MGKAKKGKKVDEENEVSNSVDVDDEIASKSKKKEKKRPEPVDSGSEDDLKTKKNSKKDGKKFKDDNAEKPSAGGGKTGKKDKKKVVSDDEDDSKKKSTSRKLMKDASSDDDDDDVAVSAKSSKKKTKGGGGGFAALAMDDDGDEEEAADEPAERVESENDEVEEERPQKKKDAKDKGGKKSKKKKKDDDEEDLDKILAELQMEYTGGAPPEATSAAEVAVVEKKGEEETESSKKKKKKKNKAAAADAAVELETGEGDGSAAEGEGDDEEAHTVKSAAQKKKEKKEREKQKRLAEKAKDKQDVNETSESVAQESVDKEEEKESGAEDEDDDKKKKKKKKKGEKEEKPSGKLNKKMLAAIQETLKIQKEEEERLRKEEEERTRKEEEAERLRQEQMRLEQEKKEKRKQKEKEKKERLKAEGKLLNSKQKADRAKAQALLEAMNAMRIASGAEPITPSAPKSKTSFIKTKKKKPQTSDSTVETHPPTASNGTVTETPNSVKVEIVDRPSEPPSTMVVDEGDEEVKDSWDADSDREEKSEEDKKEPAQPAPVDKPTTRVTESKKLPARQKSESESVATEETESESDSESGSDSNSSSDSEDDKRKKTDAQKKREKVLERIKKRQETAEAKRTLDELRAAVVCVLGHVDTGKTKILDKLRRTNVQDGEAGGITQQIGATNVPIDAIKEQSKHVKGFSQLTLKIPGLLIIDTPGHESFSNLRSRGSSLCDLAILVVDIMHGLEPQTIESIQLLKDRRTPFIVALNKIDRLYDWQTMNKKDVRDIIKAQAPNTQLEFEQRTKEVIVQFAEQGLNAALFYENPDVRSYVSLVPTSAITGEGMGNLLALIVEYCQTRLAKRLMFSEELQATVLEVKAIPGLGTTIDVILVNGHLREGDTAILAGTEAPIVTQIRSLLMPQPMKELRVKNAYVEYKEIKAAQGVKIAAKDLEKVIAGLNLRIAEKPDEVDILKEEVARELKSALSSIKLQERGVYVQASTLGSLEALLEFLRTSSIPYANIRIGPVVKKDVMKASIMLEHDSQYAVILAFDVKIERDAQELADSLGVRIFQADIIYHLFDKFMAYREELRNRKREEFKTIAVFPCKLKILPQFVFNSRDPIVVGVMVEAGIVKEGTPICVPSKDFVDIGIVTSIENNHKTVENARKGQEVCIKIEPIPGESPKMFGRHFDETDFLVSKISRQSIDACKDYFREDLVKTDWQLMVELKKLFQIL